MNARRENLVMLNHDAKVKELSLLHTHTHNPEHNCMAHVHQIHCPQNLIRPPYTTIRCNTIRMDSSFNFELVVLHLQPLYTHRMKKN